MMKKMKKIMALVIAMVMVIAMSATVFAAPGDLTSDTSISVTGLAEGDVVTYYQVIEWKDGTGWAFKAPFNTLTDSDLTAILGTPAVADDPSTTEVDESKPAVPGAITQDLANRIAALATSGGTTDSALTDTTTWLKDNPAAGLYMVVIAAATPGVVYNPAFVGADFTGNNGTNTISIEASYSGSAVAKKSDINTTKTVDEAEDAIKSAKASAVGDIVSFDITTTIPVYLDSYKNPSFTVYDTVSDGLELVVDEAHPIVVKYGQTIASATADKGGDTNVTITKTSNKAFNADFAKTYFDNNTSAVPVTITYFAKITSEANFNVNEEDNIVTVTYSNGPSDEKGAMKDRTNHYTFSIGANVLGQTSYKASELVKVGLDREGNPIEREIELDNKTKHAALAGAKFGLYSSQDCADTSKIAEFTTSTDGIITFKGLDAGTYYVKEISAPNGYIKDANAHKVVITAEYEPQTVTDDTVVIGEKTYKVPAYDVSTLKSYTVTVDDTTASTFTVTNQGPSIISSTTGEASTDIVNIKGTELPSTGGIGTTIFYVVGAILVLGAGILLVTRRRMKAE